MPVYWWIRRCGSRLVDPYGRRGPGMQWPDGIGGLDPRVHASFEVGRRNVEHGVKAIGEKAQELLASLPEGRRAFRLPSLSPEHWWYI